MLFKFHKKLHRQIFELSVTFIVVWAFVVSSLLPQVADAKTNKLASFSQIFSKPALLGQVQKTFPKVSDIVPRKVVWVTMTAYSSEVAQTDSTPCIPADASYDLCENYAQTGARDTIATNFLPLGTKVRFPDIYGDKVFTVRDRMNQRYGYGRGDIWMPDTAEAKQFGVKRLKMEIYYR